MTDKIEPVPVEDYNKPDRGRTTGDAIPANTPSRQSIIASDDYRTVDVHQLIDEAYYGNGGFLGLTSGSDKYGNKRVSYVTAKKTEWFYQSRVANGQYINEFAGFVDSLVDPIISSGITYDTTDNGFLEWADRVNGQGFSLDELKQLAGKMAVAHDISFFIMDAERATGRVKLYYKTPTDVCEDSIVTDSWGELKEIAFIIGYDETMSAIIRHRHIVGFVLVEKQTTTNAKWELVEAYPTGVPVLNVYPMYYNPTPNGEYVPSNPRMMAIVYLSANIYNKDVLVDYTALQQGMGFLVIKSSSDDKVNGIADPLSSGIQLRVKEGTSGVGAEFITIDPEILQKTSDLVEKKRYALYRLMGKEGVDAVQGTNAPESGVSKAFDFIGRNQSLLKAVRMYQKLDEWIVSTYRLFTSDTVGRDIQVNYPEDFFPAPILTIDEAILAFDVFERKGLQENAKEALKVISLNVSNGASYDRKKELQEEIDNAEIATTEEILD